MSYFSPNPNTIYTQPPPSHTQHASSDMIPSARGNSTVGADYSSGVLDDAGTWEQGPTYQGTQQSDVPSEYGLSSATGGRAGPRTKSGQGNTAFNADRPLNVQPSSAGGVAVGGRDDLPEGKATFIDKMVGKVQKLTGKYTKNPEMHERGELRESGGKAAALGQARAPHD